MKQLLVAVSLIVGLLSPAVVLAVAPLALPAYEIVSLENV